MNINLLIERVEKLKHRPKAHTEAIDAIRDWLLQSKILQRVRINPYHVAKYSGLGVDVIVPEFLKGVTVGLFDLHWDIHCPHCNMITTECKHLVDVSGVSFCPMCEVNFEADFSDRVEVTFSLRSKIEGIKIPPVCAPPSALNPRFQLVTYLNETASAVTTLKAGRYRYYCPITLAKGILVVEGNSAEETQLIQIKQLEGKYFDHPELSTRPGQIKFELTNVGHPLSGMQFHEDELSAELTPDQIPLRLSGLQIIHFPDYQRIFGNEVLSVRERMIIRAVTIMFTDLCGSTSMYEQLGDIKAYNLVRDHFEIFFQTVEKHGGTVLKTIGDAVMASFMTNEQALKAATAAQIAFREYNRKRPEDEHVNMKIGIHRGSAVLVNLNNRLDYFGLTVNKAARIQGVANAGEISFSEEVYDDESVLATLQAMDGWKIERCYEELKGIKDKQIVYKIRLPTERKISPLQLTFQDTQPDTFSVSTNIGNDGIGKYNLLEYVSACTGWVNSIHTFTW